MSTYTQIYYHIVFSTKNREKVLLSNNRDKLLKYIWGITKNMKCHLYRINAVQDHLHILIHLHPAVCLSEFVKAVKTGSSKWIREERIFPDFRHWQDGYGAFTYSNNDKESVVEYIKKQEEHHKKITFKEEYVQMLKNAGIKYEEKYLW